MRREKLLCDLEYLKLIDTQNMLEIVKALPEQMEHAAAVAKELDMSAIDANAISGIIISGMGGSAIGGDIIRNLAFETCPCPIFNFRDYKLPKFSNENSLVLSTSYSGNTEETISTFHDSLARGCKNLAITSGGKLEELCKEHNVPYVKLPSGIPPRTAIGYLLTPMIVIFKRLGYIAENDDIAQTIQHLKDFRPKLLPENDTKANPAKQIAAKIHTSIPAIYSTAKYSSIARRWRNQLNENAKMLAISGVFPEMNHNDIVAWEKDRRVHLFSAVIFREQGELPEITERIELTKKLVMGNAKKMIEVWAEGDSMLERMMHAFFLGDFVSIYAAILNGYDPTPVPAIERLKRELHERRAKKANY